METTVIRGSGVAAVCCARSLFASKLSVNVAGEGQARNNSILLSEGSQSLLQDLFEGRQLFLDLPRIRRRVVSWGPGVEALTMAHSAVVIAEDMLLKRLWSALPAPVVEGAVGWEILSSGALDRSPDQAMEQKEFGTQIALIQEVTLRREEGLESCWTESVQDGWLFLFASDGLRARLMSVGASSDVLLGQSRLIAGEIETMSGPTMEFPAYPRILSPLCGARWLACGSGAMAFDPLCGEGAGNAVREAILASAVVRAAARGAEVEGLLEHYSARLLQGFARHLEMCLRFYTSGGDGEFWTSQGQVLREGIAWCRSQPLPRPKYRLVGFDLEEI